MNAVSLLSIYISTFVNTVILPLRIDYQSLGSNLINYSSKEDVFEIYNKTGKRIYP